MGFLTTLDSTVVHVLCADGSCRNLRKHSFVASMDELKCECTSCRLDSGPWLTRDDVSRPEDLPAVELHLRLSKALNSIAVNILFLLFPIEKSFDH